MNVTTIIPFFGGDSSAAHSLKENRFEHLKRCIHSVRYLWPVIYVCNKEDAELCRTLSVPVMLFDGVNPVHLPYHACVYAQSAVKEGVVIYTEADQVFSFNADIVKIASELDGYISPHRFEEDYNGIVFDIYEDAKFPIQQVLGRTFVVNNFEQPKEIRRGLYKVSERLLSFGAGWVVKQELFKKVVFTTPEKLPIEHPSGLNLFDAMPCYKTANPYGFYVEHLSGIEFHKRIYEEHAITD